MIITIIRIKGYKEILHFGCTLDLSSRLKDGIQGKNSIKVTKPRGKIMQINRCDLHGFVPNTAEVIVTCPERI